MYSEDSEEGRFLKSLGFDKYDLSSKSAIPSVRNFENEMIYRYLPQIVERVSGLKSVYENEYEKDRDSLSQGIGAVSKKVYVKTRLKQDIDNEINYFRNNPQDIAQAVGVDKAIKLDAMMNYRKLSKDLRREAALLFKQKTNRLPTLKYSNEELNILIPNYDDLPEEEQAYELNELKLNDIYLLTTLGDQLKRD